MCSLDALDVVIGTYLGITLSLSRVEKDEASLIYCLLELSLSSKWNRSYPGKLGPVSQIASSGGARGEFARRDKDGRAGRDERRPMVLVFKIPRANDDFAVR